MIIAFANATNGFTSINNAVWRRYSSCVGFIERHIVSEMFDPGNI